MKRPTTSARAEHQAPGDNPTSPTEGAGLPGVDVAEGESARGTVSVDLRPPKKRKPVNGPKTQTKANRGGYREGAGRPLGASKKPYNILFYIKRRDVIEAVKVINEKVRKDKDFSAAVYIVNQSCGMPLTKRENIGPQDGGRQQVVIILPEKAADFRLHGAAMVQLPEKSSGEEAKMERLLGKVSVSPANAGGKGQSASVEVVRGGKRVKKGANLPPQ